jgi:transcriptional regulator with XRE-family HTH domain
MAILHELSSIVKRQRTDMGLSQERLAELAGLSRATINELESGKLTNLSLIRAERLANILGLGIGVTGVRRTKDERAGSAFDSAVRSANVSYGEGMPPDVLRRALITGVMPPKYMAQLRAFLDEAPLSVLSAVAAELEAETGKTSKSTWQKMRQLAVSLACTRGIWS